jgi:SH3-like domain-containing protein
VRISREHSNWTEVVFADGEMGWIRNAHIEAI